MGNSTARRPSGRRAGVSGTRSAILDAARELYAERGYEAVSLREVARRAGVDPALVRHYHGTKDRLFAATLSLPFNPAEALPAILEGDPDRVGWRIVEFFLETWDVPQNRRLIVSLLGAAFSLESAAQLLREVIARFAVAPLAAAAGDGRPRLRAELAGSHLAGIAVARYVIRVEPLASASREEIVALVGPTLQAYLRGRFTS